MDKNSHFWIKIAGYLSNLNIKNDFENLLEHIKDLIIEANVSVFLYVNRENDDSYSSLYHNMQMKREYVKLEIYNGCMALIESYNLINKKFPKTPDYLYSILISECNQNLLICNQNVISKFKLKFENILEQINQMVF